MMENCKSRLRAIACFIFDVDGVLTNGNLFIGAGGGLVRTMNIRDGYALQLAVRQGYRVAVISGGRPEGVPERMKHLGITDVFMDTPDKEPVLRSYLDAGGLQPVSALYMGDDLPDIKAMQICGVAACPADAAREIKEISHFISAFPGGEGCVRDVIEQTLRLHGKWE